VGGGGVRREHPAGSHRGTERAQGPGGNAVEGANVAATQKRLDRLHDKLKDIHQAIKDADSNNQTAAAGVGFHVVAGVNGAASNGHRRGR
jgi:hypothetical protein